MRGLVAAVVVVAGVAVAQSAPRRVDTHVHLTMSHAAIPLFHGEPGDGQLTHTPGVRLINQVEADQLLASGVNLVYGAMWVPNPWRPGRDVFGETANQVEQLKAFTERRAPFAFVTTAAQARREIGLGRVAVFAQVEGGEGLRRADDVDRLYSLGVRCITVVHMVDTQLGGAAQGQMTMNLLGVWPDHLNEHGLSALGQQVVTRMMDLGMVIDVSHASDATIRDILALTEPRGVPVLFSHGGARALMNVERNISDELAKRIVEGGGLVGVTMYPKQLLTAKEQQLTPHASGTCDDFVAHWKHLASVVGPEALVFGSDMNGFTIRPKAGGRCAHGLRNTGDLGELFDALTKDGVPQAAVDGMGERVLHLIETVEAKADPAAQQRASMMRVDVGGHLFAAP